MTRFHRAPPTLTRRRALALSAGVLGALASRAAAAAGDIRPGRIPYGACVRYEPLVQDPGYRAAIKTYCDQLTPEGDLVWAHLRPSRDQFRFEYADGIVAFAMANEMTVRGHTLVWYGAMPEWTKAIAGAGEAEHEMTSHIERVVSRYRGKIKIWNVVNEPIDDAKIGTPGLRPNVWLQNLGDKYIDLAFAAARRADPAAELVLNDYGIESADGRSPKKREALRRLIHDLLGRGVPVQGIGLQGHINGNYEIDRDGLYEFVDEIRSLGLSVHVTELDVTDDGLPAPIAVRDAMVAARAADFLQAVTDAARPAVIATWGITDRYTWVPTWYKRKDGLPNRPLPLDDNYQPKPLWRVIDYFCGK